MIFADFIRNKRNELDLTQVQLANLIDVDKQSVSNWECGRNEPWPKEQERICAILDKPGSVRGRRASVIDRILNDAN